MEFIPLEELEENPLGEDQMPQADEDAVPDSMGAFAAAPVGSEVVRKRKNKATFDRLETEEQELQKEKERRRELRYRRPSAGCP